MLTAFRRLFATAPRWPAGEPLLSAAGQRIGTVTATGVIVFAPGLRAERLSGEQPDDADDADHNPDARQHKPADRRVARIAGKLEAAADLRLQRVVDPLADAREQQSQPQKRARNEPAGR